MKVMSKILALILSLSFFTEAQADELRIMRTIKDESANAFVGTYRSQNNVGQIIILTIEKQGDFLVATQQEGTSLETVFKFPLLTSDFKAPEEIKYENFGSKITVTNSSYKILSDSHLRMDSESVQGKFKTVSETEIAIDGKNLSLNVEATEYMRKSILVSWQPTKAKAARKLMFVKMTSSVMERKLLKELQAKWIARSSKQTDAELRERLQQQTDKGYPVLDVQLDIQKEASVQRPPAEIIPWVVPPKPSMNYFNEGHTAKIISYEKFLEYQSKRVCDLILNGEIIR